MVYKGPDEEQKMRLEGDAWGRVKVLVPSVEFRDERLPHGFWQLTSG